MYIQTETLDDLMREVLRVLLASSNHVTPSKGKNTELTAVLLKVKRPRARLSRTERKGTLFSCLGELLWYLSERNDLDFITYYIRHYKVFSDDKRTIFGGYGPRLFNMRGVNQISNVIDLLRRNSSSRRATVQLFNAEDLIGEHKDIPCTCTMQFMIRNNQLEMFTNMRSNDAFLGLPHDIFAFTMLQEIVARALDVELGTYAHAVGSLHLYDKNKGDAKQFLDEGWQSIVEMPPMPAGDPRPALRKLREAEQALRGGLDVNQEALGMHEYWQDIIRVLKVFALSKRKLSQDLDLAERQAVVDAIEDIRVTMSSPIYDVYIRKIQQSKQTPTEEWPSR